MTKKIHTDERERWNLTERLHRQTLTVEHDWNMDEYDRKCINNKKSLRQRTWTGEFDQKNIKISFHCSNWLSLLEFNTLVLPASQQGIKSKARAIKCCKEKKLLPCPMRCVTLHFSPKIVLSRSMNKNTTSHGLHYCYVSFLYHR